MTELVRKVCGKHLLLLKAGVVGANGDTHGNVPFLVDCLGHLHVPLLTALY